jgi:hypothetical protein
LQVVKRRKRRHSVPPDPPPPPPLASSQQACRRGQDLRALLARAAIRKPFPAERTTFLCQFAPTPRSGSIHSMLPLVHQLHTQQHIAVECKVVRLYRGDGGGGEEEGGGGEASAVDTERNTHTCDHIPLVVHHFSRRALARAHAGRGDAGGDGGSRGGGVECWGGDDEAVSEVQGLLRSMSDSRHAARTNSADLTGLCIWRVTEIAAQVYC